MSKPLIVDLELIEKALIDLAPNLHSRLNLFSDADITSILFRKLTKPQNEIETLEANQLIRRYFTLTKEAFASQSAARALNEAGPKPRTIEECKLLSFLYFVIFLDLDKKQSPLASYYCDISYQQYPMLKLENFDKLDYTEFESYYYAKSFEKDGRFTPEKSVLADYVYTKIVESEKEKKSAATQLIGMAKVKLCLRRTKNFAQILKSLEQVRKEHAELGYFINAERDWIKLCDFAKKFKSDKPSVQHLLNYLETSTSLECALLKEYNILEENLQPISDIEEGKLMQLLKTAEKSRNEPCVIPDAISKDKTIRAFLVYYAGLDEKDKNYSPEKHKFYILKAWQANDPVALYDLYQNYENYLADIDVAPASAGAAASAENAKQSYGDFIQDIGQAADLHGDRGEEYLESAKRFFLDKAAWSGHAQAQYELSKYYLELYKNESPSKAEEGMFAETRAIKTAILELRKQSEALRDANKNDEAQDLEKNITDLLERFKKIDTLRERQIYFLSLAASQDCTEAQYDFALALESEAIYFGDPNACYEFYGRAATQGHEKSIKKCEEAIKRSQNITPETITRQDFDFLESLSKIDEKLGVLFADFIILNPPTVAWEEGEYEKKLTFAIQIYEILSSESPRAKLQYIFLTDRIDLLKELALDPSEQEQEYLEETFCVRSDNAPEHFSENLSILAVNFNRILKILTKSEKASLSTDKKEWLAKIKQLAKNIIEKSSHEDYPEVKIEYANILLCDPQKCDKGQDILKLLIDALLLYDEAHNANALDESTQSDCTQKIAKLLETADILINPKFSYKQVIKLCKLDFEGKLKSKFEFTLAQRILESLEITEHVAETENNSGAAAEALHHEEQIDLPYNEEEKSALQKQIVKLLLLSSINQDRAPELLASLFCDKKYDLKLEEIKKFKEWKSVRKKYNNKLAARIVEIGNSLQDKDLKKQYQEEFIYYYEASTNKKELQDAYADWIIEKKAKNTAPQKYQETKPENVAPVENIAPQKTDNASEAGAAAAVESKASSKASGKNNTAPKLSKYQKKRAKKQIKVNQKEPSEEAATSSSATTPTLDSQSDADESKAQSKSDSSTPPLPLSPAAAEFFPPAQTETFDHSTAPLPATAADLFPPAQEESWLDAREVEMFLKGDRKIKSTEDLPEFLRLKIDKLLEAGCQVILKGSAVYQPMQCPRVPSDLDIEIFVNKMSTWENGEIQKFIGENFDEKMIIQQIYRKGEHFTVNCKDQERKIDISFYETGREPQLELGWAANRECRLLLTQGHSQDILPRGLSEYIETITQRGELNFDIWHDFYINPKAHGLILRLCFLQTIGLASEEEMATALTRDLMESPIELLFREFKIDQLLNFPQADLRSAIDSNISEVLNHATTSHFSDNENLKTAFFKNLETMANFHNPKSSYVERAGYIIKIVKEVLLEKISTKSPENTTASARADTLQRNATVKTTASL